SGRPWYRAQHHRGGGRVFSRRYAALPSTNEGSEEPYRGVGAEKAGQPLREIITDRAGTPLDPRQPAQVPAFGDVVAGERQRERPFPQWALPPPAHQRGTVMGV